MARRILPAELKRVRQCLFVRPHEARQLLFKTEASVSLSHVRRLRMHAETRA